jgi:hypothetical protein
VRCPQPAQAVAAPGQATSGQPGHHLTHNPRKACSKHSERRPPAGRGAPKTREVVDDPLTPPLGNRLIGVKGPMCHDLAAASTMRRQRDPGPVPIPLVSIIGKREIEDHGSKTGAIEAMITSSVTRQTGARAESRGAPPHNPSSVPFPQSAAECLQPRLLCMTARIQRTREDRASNERR